MKERILVVEHEEAFPSSVACADEDKTMSAYIEIVAAVARWRFELDSFDLRIIGEFTRAQAGWIKATALNSASTDTKIFMRFAAT
jgi:hypothetical protein